MTDRCRLDQLGDGSTPVLAIAGLGLIGSSVGLAARASGWTVVGFDISAAIEAKARALGAVDAVAGSIAEMGASSIDLVVLAVPPSVTASTARPSSPPERQGHRRRQRQTRDPRRAGGPAVVLWGPPAGR